MQRFRSGAERVLGDIIGEAREDPITSEGLVRTGRVREVCKELLEIVSLGCSDRYAGCTFQLGGGC